MPFIACLILAFEPLNWEFPWWVWILAASHSGNEITIRFKERKKS